MRSAIYGKHSGIKRGLLGLAIWLSLFSGANAQIAVGGLTGVVKDAQGAVIPDARITLMNTVTNVSQTTRSTDTGVYVFNAVGPGTYTLSVAKNGFQKYIGQNVEIHIQVTDEINVTLQPGSVTEQITVSAAPPLLQTQDALVGKTIDGKEIDTMPLVSRDWTSLGQLAAGVATNPGGKPGDALSQTSGYSVQGGAASQNDVRLNGINDNQEMWTQGAVILPPPDAIQEFKLQASNFSAEFGHSTGGIINAVIKSGTNGLHGALWEYVRNEAFNANDYFTKRQNLRRTPYKQHVFGFTAGGPVVIPGLYDGRNRTFFFVDYQGTRRNSATSAAGSTSTVPTVNMRNSNFTNFQDLFTLSSSSNVNTDALGRKLPYGTIFDPATTRVIPASGVDPVTGLTGKPGGYVRDPFYAGGSVSGITDFTNRTSHLNLLPSVRLDPTAINLLKLYPIPTSGTARLNYFNVPIDHNTGNSYDVRIDHTLGTKDSFFGTWSWIHNLDSIDNPLPGYANGQSYGSGIVDDPRSILAVGHTHVFSPSLMNELHAGWIQMRHVIQPFEGNTMGIPDKYGIPGIPQSGGNGGLPSISIGGERGIGIAGYVPTLISSRTIELMENVTKQYGSHTFKAGFQLDHIAAPITQPPNPKGSFSYSGQYTDIPNANQGQTGMADMLLIPQGSTVPGGINGVGGLSSYAISKYKVTKDIRNYTSFYGQDDWKVNTNLTLNLGLRWDYFQPYRENNGGQANLVFSGGGNGVGGSYYIPQQGCNTPRSATFDALLAASNIAVNCTANSSLTQSRFLNLAPRIGFAYQATPKTVIRGGFGIVYGNLENIGYGDNLGNNYPFGYTVTFTSINSQTPLADPTGTKTATITNAFAANNFQNPASVGGNARLTGRQYDFKVPSIQSFNLTIQQQLAEHDSIQVAFVGNVGRHVDAFGSHNAPTAITPPGTNLYDPTITGHYPAPLLQPDGTYLMSNAVSNYNSLQAVYAHQGPTLRTEINYTFSKCLTDAWSFAYRALWVAGAGMAKDYAPCSADVAHIIHASGVYTLPFGRGQKFASSVGPLLNQLIGGWRLNYILTYQSGRPFTVGCLQGTAQDLGCVANTVPGANLYASHKGVDQWLNPRAFSQPPTATTAGQGDLSPLGGARNAARAAGLQNADLSVSKVFPIHEQFNAEFRAEAFNAFNWVSLGTPSNLRFNNLSPTTANPFSNITSDVVGPRIMQFAVKVHY